MQRMEMKRQFLRKECVYGAAALAAVLLMSGSGIVGHAREDDERLSAGVEAALEGEVRQPEETDEDEEFLEEGMAGEAAVSLHKTSESLMETGAESRPAEEEEMVGTLVMTSVVNTLNVRSEPDEEAEKVGYLYADCGGTVLERKDGWTKLESGELTGWAKDEYLLFGEEALEEVKEVGRTVAHVTGETLRIRKEPSADAEVYDLAAKGETFEVVDKEQLEYSDKITLDAEWAAIDYEGGTGYVSADYIEVDFEYDYGETLEEIAAREAARTAAGNGAGSRSSADGAPQKKSTGSIPAGTSDITLLAALIQCEAGGESYEGQLAVGAVVANRVKSGSYPNTVTDVIFASGQFTPAGSGKLANLVSSGNIKQSCIQAATEALSGVTNVGGATHFRRAGGRDGIIIGNHVFW